MQESLLESRQAKQIQQELPSYMAAPGPKSDKFPVSHVIDCLFVPPTHERRHQIFHTPCKMELPRCNGTDILGWIFKVNFKNLCWNRDRQDNFNRTYLYMWLLRKQSQTTFL